MNLVLTNISVSNLFMGLNQWLLSGVICPPADIWQCLKSFLVVTTVGVLVAASGTRRGMQQIFYNKQNSPHNKELLISSPNCHFYQH